jgi:hypothetical protein
VPAVASKTAALHGPNASTFSDRVPANFDADSSPHGACNFSNIRASISYQSDQASRRTTHDARTRTRRTAFDARFTRNGHNPSQVNSSQTSAAMFVPYFVKISYLLRP